jgi:hypothetical protein
MATSSNPPTPSSRDPQATSSGLTTGTGPDLSGTAAPAKPTAKPRTRAKGAQQGADTAAAAVPAEGLSGAKPATKAKGKAGAEGKAASAKGRTGTAEAAQPAASGTASRDTSADTSGGAGSGAGGESNAAPTQPEGRRIADEERQRRIAEAAYRKAQERGFGGDRHIDDWLEAEREFDQGGGHAG